MLVNKKCVGTIAPLLGLPSVLTEFMWSFARMTDYSNHYVCGPDQYVEIVRPAHSFHSVARNQVARAATGEWLLQIDADHSFAPDLLFRLLNTMNTTGADVVSALYLMKSYPHRPAAWKYFEDGSHTQYVEWPPGERVEVDVVGAGCLLVKTAVFRRMWDELGEEPFSTQEFPGTVGEDFAFCRRCKKLGIQIILDTAIECHHLQVRPLEYGKHNDPDAGPSRSVGAKKALAKAGG